MAELHPNTTNSTNLSPALHKTLVLLASGYTPKEISNILFISREAIKTRMRKLREHFRARTTAQAVALAYEEGILTRESRLTYGEGN